MLDKSDITFVGRQMRLKLRQICHHTCPRQMYNKCSINIYILLDVLLCSIAEYFYELCRILASP